MATPAAVLALTLGTIGSTPVLADVARRWRSATGERGVPVWGLARDCAMVGLLLVSAMQVASGTYNPFIYFRF